MKDPAFLFYSKDFYEGTRTMYPGERACYVDLMIFQHQNGPIPDDMQRLTMYCSGIDEATLKAVLKAKFKQTDKGWINDKLQRVIDERQEYVGKQSENGRIGQFWKKAKALLDNEEYKNLKGVITQDDIIEYAKNNEINKATLKALLEASLKQYAIANAISSLSSNPDFDYSILKQNHQKIESWYSAIVFSKNLPVEFDKFCSLLDNFCERQESLAKPYKNVNDYTDHFVNWVEIQVKKPENQKERRRMP